MTDSKRMVKIRSVLLTLLFLPALGSVSTVAAAQERCEPLFAAQPIRMPFQSSVEIEIGASPKVIELFDTLDGTIRPVAGEAGVEAIPETILKSLREYVGQEGDPLDAPWDVLSHEEKRELIMRSAEMRNQDFGKSRTVPGLRYRERVKLSFTEKTRFLGRDYKPGVYTVPLSDVFGPTAIEFMGPNRMRADLGFELHVRSALPSGENLLSARSLQKALVGTEQNVHLHVVAERPVSLAQKPSRLQRFWRGIAAIFRRARLNENHIATFRAADFIHRTMLYFEIQMIENGVNMRVLEGAEGGINFYPVNPASFHAFNRSMYESASGQGERVRTKSGTVGLRTPHFYDQDVWGIEVRYLSPKLDRQVTASVLTQLQQRMLRQDFFMSEEQARDFLASQSLKPKKFDEMLDQMIYSSDFESRIRRGLNPEEQEFMRQAAEENDFVKMLMHDWTRDPLFYGSPDRVRQINETQQYCLELLLRGQSSIEVMKIFIRRSGIAFELRRVLGLQARGQS